MKILWITLAVIAVIIEVIKYAAAEPIGIFEILCVSSIGIDILVDTWRREDRR
jgi:hypothetical protein